MVLVDAQAVPAELLRILELVQILVVERVADGGVVVAVGKGHPRRRLVVLHRVRHEVEVVELHRVRVIEWRQNSDDRRRATASGSSRCGTWPERLKRRSWRRGSRPARCRRRREGPDGRARPSRAGCAPGCARVAGGAGGCRDRGSRRRARRPSARGQLDQGVDALVLGTRAIAAADRGRAWPPAPGCPSRREKDRSSRRP